MSRICHNAITNLLLLVAIAATGALAIADDNDRESDLVRKLEEHRISAINKVVGSVVAIYDDDRQGGGSGVIIDPSGIALTQPPRHHGRWRKRLGRIGRWKTLPLEADRN